MNEPRLVVAASPHLKGRATTPGIMWAVVGSLVPIIAASAFFFGISALLVVGAATLGAVATEAAFGRRDSSAGVAGPDRAAMSLLASGAAGRPAVPAGPALRVQPTLLDGSAIITGLLLGLTLPPGLPLWMAFLGGVFAIGFGKLIFGGLGQNIFNPALLGRAFLQAAFPVAMTTWAVPGAWWSLRGDNFAMPFFGADPTIGVTGPTPLGLMKFESVETPLSSLFLGTTGGSIGETSTLLILLCGGYLAWKRYLNWRIPAGIFATVALLSAGLHALRPEVYPPPLFMLFSGGLALGAVYMATDLVTSPVTNLGRWIFAAGIGILVVVIRIWGGLPEAVMYAILLMNPLVPFINQATQPRVFGSLRRVSGGGGP